MANKLSLNTKKSNFVIFRPYQKRINFDVTTKLFDDKNSLILLQGKYYVKYLGVLIDSTLPWKQHILFISSKISNFLVIISSLRLRHFVPIDTLLSKHISVFDSALYNLWYCCMGPSCSNKSVKATNLAKTCSSSITLCSLQISCNPVI